jgi:subtilisin family serine protease
MTRLKSSTNRHMMTDGPNVNCTFFWMVVAVTGLFLVTPPSAEAQVQPRVSDSLLEKADAEGIVRVIVELGAAFIPEGNLANTAATDNQRATIRDSADSVLSRLAGQQVGQIKRFSTIPYLAVEVDGSALRLLNTLTDVIRVEEDTLNRPSLFQSGPLVGAQDAWASGATGAGWTIAVIDTGVDKNHPFLAGRVVSEACYSSTFTGASTSLCPGGANSTAPGSGVHCTLQGCDHGTHVAGIAAGKGPNFSGIAPDASIIAVQVFSRFDSFATCNPDPAPCILAFTSDTLLGLERVFQLRATFKIAAVNLSLGGSPSTTFCDTDPRKAIIDQLRSVNIATVIASGNSGFVNAISQPACISTAISVAATTKSDGVAGFSNTVSFLSLFAPGQSISSSIPGSGFGSKSGTSMAAPHVAGGWGVLKQRSPGASVSEILTALRSTGQPILDSGNGLTFPRIRVKAALDALIPIRGDDLAVDFGSAGLWLRFNNVSWTQLHVLSPEEVASGDVDGNGQADVIIDFPGSGVWVWLNNSGWFQLHHLNVAGIVTGDLDGNGKAAVLVDFPGSGLWIWRFTSGWVHLNSMSPSRMVTGDLDANGQAEAIIDFPGFGIWVLQNNAFWWRLHTLNAASLAVGDLDGGGLADVLITFPGHGLWMLRNTASWLQLHPLSPSLIVTSDLDGNGRREAIIDFPGHGVWVLQNFSAWWQLNSLNAESVTATDLDGNGLPDTVIDFGSAGLWQLMNTAAWFQLHTLSVEGIVSGNLDGK